MVRATRWLSGAVMGVFTRGLFMAQNPVNARPLFGPRWCQQRDAADAVWTANPRDAELHGSCAGARGTHARAVGWFGHWCSSRAIRNDVPSARAIPAVDATPTGSTWAAFGSCNWTAAPRPTSPCKCPPASSSSPRPVMGGSISGRRGRLVAKQRRWRHQRRRRLGRRRCPLRRWGYHARRGQRRGHRAHG